MPQLDPRIEIIRKEYGLAANDFWELPQKKGTWIAKHAALEVVAAKAGIVFELPIALEANGAEGIAAVCVRGKLGDRSEWSIGEASPKNCRNAYPWAICEKRAKDRVILKLIGLHGLAYSEDEADDFKDNAPESAPRASTQPLNSAKPATIAADLNKAQEELVDWARKSYKAIKTMDNKTLDQWSDDNHKKIADLRSVNEKAHASLTAAIRNRYDELQPLGAG